MGVVRKEDGTLHFFVNGVAQGPAAWNVPPNIYAVVDLYGQAAQATIVDDTGKGCQGISVWWLLGTSWRRWVLESSFSCKPDLFLYLRARRNVRRGMLSLSECNFLGDPLWDPLLPSPSSAHVTSHGQTPQVQCPAPTCPVTKLTTNVGQNKAVSHFILARGNSE